MLQINATLFDTHSSFVVLVLYTNPTLIRYTFIFCSGGIILTLEEKSSKSLSLARRADAARLANVGEAGWNAVAYLRADRATVAIINEGAMV